MRESVFETLVGFGVIAVAVFFLWYAMATGDATENGGGRYEVSARFDNVSGVARGADVRLAGVKVGVVQAIAPDFERFEAELVLALDENLALPDDTDARVSQDGLLGGAYIALEPGGGLDTIPMDGSGEIIFTRGSVDLLTLVSSFASGSGE